MPQRPPHHHSPTLPHPAFPSLPCTALPCPESALTCLLTPPFHPSGLAGLPYHEVLNKESHFFAGEWLGDARWGGAHISVSVYA